jgi:hypothetical protein
MILRKSIQVIMPAPMDPYQGHPGGIELLQAFAVADRDQPVPGAMNNIGMAADPGKPEVGTQVIA